MSRNSNIKQVEGYAHTNGRQENHKEMTEGTNLVLLLDEQTFNHKRKITKSSTTKDCKKTFSLIKVTGSAAMSTQTWNGNEDAKIQKHGQQRDSSHYIQHDHIHT